MFISFEPLLFGNIHCSFSNGEDNWCVKGEKKDVIPCMYCKLDSTSFPIKAYVPEGPVLGNCF